MSLAKGVNCQSLRESEVKKKFLKYAVTFEWCQLIWLLWCLPNGMEPIARRMENQEKGQNS